MKTLNQSSSSTEDSNPRAPDGDAEEQARQVFFEDTEQILHQIRDLLELPLLTYEQKQQVKDIMGSLFELRRTVEEGQEVAEPQPTRPTQIDISEGQDRRIQLLAQQSRKPKARLIREQLSIGLAANSITQRDDEEAE